MKSYVWWLRGDSHCALALQSSASVLKADPEARTIFLDDRFPDLRVMPANVAAQCEYVLQAQNGEELWFIDADTLLVRPLELPDCDLAVTWRDHVGRDEAGEKVEGIAKEMPYNYGVIGVRVNAASREAFLWLRERVRNMHAQYQEWYGNQIALAHLCGPAPIEGERIVTREIPWALGERQITSLRVAQLPCEEWNYTPYKPGESIEGKRLLHFKGHARELMGVYAESLGLKKIEAAA